MGPPGQADLDTLRTDLEQIISSGSDARRKAAAQAFVHRLVVVEPGVIQPTYLMRGGIPTDPADNPGQTAPKSASRAVTDLVDLTCQHPNQGPVVADGPEILVRPIGSRGPGS